MRRRARHHDRDLTEPELAETVEERDRLAKRPAFEQLVGDLLERRTAWSSQASYVRPVTAPASE